MLGTCRKWLVNNKADIVSLQSADACPPGKKRCSFELDRKVLPLLRGSVKWYVIEKTDIRRDSILNGCYFPYTSCHYLS